MSKKTKELETKVEYLRSVITELKEKLDFVADDVMRSNNYVQALEREFKPKAYLTVSSYLYRTEYKSRLSVAYYYEGEHRDVDVTAVPEEYKSMLYKDQLKVLNARFSIKENEDYITIYDKITRDLYLVNKSEEHSSKSNCQVVSMLFKRDK